MIDFSDCSQLAGSRLPFFGRKFLKDGSKREAMHLIICVHGLEGSSDDLRPYRNYLRMMIGSDRARFLMSEANTVSDYSICCYML